MAAPGAAAVVVQVVGGKLRLGLAWFGFAWLCFALLCFALLCFASLCFASLCFGLLWWVGGWRQETARMREGGQSRSVALSRGGSDEGAHQIRI